MYLTKDSIAANGVLIVKKIDNSPYDHAYVYGCYRFFYALNNGASSPEDLADRNSDGVPDYVENLLYKLETARLLLTKSFHLKDPLLTGFFHAKGAKFIDVYLNDIPREHGLASGTVFDDRHEILDDSAFHGKSLKLTLHRNLKARTETPLHELFHLFQYNYSQFNNPWFMEGLGRWSQRIISEGSGREEKLPSSAIELEALLNKAHEAEYFWNRLSSLCDERGTFAIPESLRKNEEIANNARPGGKLIKAVLENTDRQCRLIEEKVESRHLSSLAYWTREKKRSLANNQHILLAIFDAIQACTDGKNEELSSFIDTITPLIHPTSADFAVPEIQDFMRALKLCDAAYVKADENKVLYSEHFDLLTRTFSAPTLNCSHPALTDADLKTFKVIKRVHGNLELTNPNITCLEGWDNLEVILGRLVLGDSGIEHIDGMNKLRTVGGITISGMNCLLGISGLNRLATVSGTIRIANNANLLNINGFNSLNEINNGALEILENGTLESLSGFNQLKTLRGDLLISKCMKLATLSGLSSLCAAANIFVSETNLADVSTLKNLFREQKDFPGYIKIIANRISSVSFMRGLRSVASSLYLHQNRLTNLEGLEALETVGASLSLANNRLSDISSLSGLNKINGVLSLSSNRLTSLHGLKRLQSIKTTSWNGTPLTIKFQDNMTDDGRISLIDISALANVKEVGGHLIIFVDPHHTYASMPVQGSAYHANKITYFSNQTDESGRMLHTFVESIPAARPAPDELRVAQNTALLMQATSKNSHLIKTICELGANDFSDSPYHHRKFSLPVALFREAALERGYTFEKVTGRYFTISNMDGWEIFFINNPGCCVTSTNVCNNKNLTKDLLGLRGIPVPKGKVFVDEAKALEYFLSQKQLQVVKPINGYGGKGITSGIADELYFSAAWNKARKLAKEVIIEDYAFGEEVRVIVFGGKALAAICNIPANVLGDGVHSISELVKLKNIARKNNPDSAEDPITSFDYLEITSRSLDDIPARGEYVRLSKVQNISVGGEAVNIIGYLHPNILDLAIKAAAAIPGATVLGFDILVRDFTSGVVEGNATIIEVNFNSSIPMACFCTYGCPVSELPGAIIDIVRAGHYDTAIKNHGEIRIEPAKTYIQVPTGDTSHNSHALLKQAAYARNFTVESLRNNFAIISHSGRSIAVYDGMCSRDRLLGCNATKDRIWSKKLLKSACINTPAAMVFSKTNCDGAWRFVKNSEMPMVVKPVSNVGSINEYVEAASLESFDIAFDAVCAFATEEVLIEEFVPGNNYRVLVVGNSISAVVQRVPTYLLGNKKHKIDVWVEPEGKMSVSEPCSDSEPIKSIHDVQSNLVLETLIKRNISETGSKDVTDSVHPDFAEIAVKVREAMYDLVRVGFDLIAEDISKSPNDQRWAVVTVTANPNLLLHHFPHYGAPRDVAGALLEYLFQGTDNPTQIMNPKQDELEVNNKSSPIATNNNLEIRILFSDIGEGWKAALSKFSNCGWLEPYFMVFESATEVVEFCRQNGIETLVGISLNSQLFLIENQDFLRANKLTFIVNDKAEIARFRNKRHFQRFMMECDFGHYVPEYYDSQEKIRYPCIVKSAFGSGGREQRIVHSSESIGTVDNTLIFSQYIPGKTEFATNIFYARGKILNHVTYKKSFDQEYFILGQDKPPLNERVETPFLDIFGAIMEKTAFTGICCFDYKIHDGIPKIFEINGRIGYTLVHHANDFRGMLQTYLDEARESPATKTANEIIDLIQKNSILE